ncbi:creatininase family protein [Paenibacillus glycanilyticus]|uniref:Creatininase family protein n=1 Tax=Paenibacillus glycanilyticus TaxID=126569 RepID=A0ABQ6GCM0_9BACL|nr:creatininase family protein [Paenibacillus glycanilyticus]GLX67008.1 hypothetical protein MU1_13520 [Paenibacillus glycanilyticus]
MNKVRWSELLPSEFQQRQTECPVVYLPMGLCEPHGQIAAFGLDTIKAEWLCEQAAAQVGGIVAPSLGYHIHESGYHARWLEDTVGENNACMTSMPPHVLLPFFLYQLRAFANAGFLGIIVISGHSGGNQLDLRRAASLFESYCGVRVWVASDPELAAGSFEGDHAGKYEISQLMYIRQDLVNFSKLNLHNEPGSGGPLAIGEDAPEASEKLGQAIMQTCLHSLVTGATAMSTDLVEIRHSGRLAPRRLTYDDVERIWTELRKQFNDWVSVSPHPGQPAVSAESQWKPYESPSAIGKEWSRET